MSQQSSRQYGADPREVQYSNGPRIGPANGIPGSNDVSRPRVLDPSSTDRRPPQYQDNYDDDYYEPASNPTSRPPAGPQADIRGRVQDQQQTGRRDVSGDNRQTAPRPVAGPAGGYDDRYDDGTDDQYRDRQLEDSRRPRNDTGNRYPADPDRVSDRRDDPRVVAGRKDGVQAPAGRQGGQLAGPSGQDKYGNDMTSENRLLKDEMNEMVHHMELLRQENDAMREKLNDSKKRERELEEMAKKKKGDGKDSDEVEKLKAELEKRTKQMEKLSKQPLGANFDGDTQKLISKIQELQKENDKLKKGLPAGPAGLNDPELERMVSTLKAKEKLIEEINEEKDELMAILEEDGSADKFKKMQKKSKELKKKNEELLMANEKMEAELLKTKPDSDYVGKSGKKGCQNCEQQKKGISTETYKTKDLPKDMRPLQELVREQESHILDLQREVDTLRHAINDYQKEIERLEAAHQDTDDTSGNNSSRLMERKAAMEDEAELRRDLEQSRRKLRSSNRRVAQLEKWLDEIYNDKNFEIVVKGAAFRGRKTTLSLPEIQGGSSGEMTARRGLGRKSFKTTEPVTAKSTRSSFNF